MQKERIIFNQIAINSMINTLEAIELKTINVEGILWECVLVEIDEDVHFSAYRCYKHRHWSW